MSLLEYALPKVDDVAEKFGVRISISFYDVNHLYLGNLYCDRIEFDVAYDGTYGLDLIICDRYLYRIDKVIDFVLIQDEHVYLCNNNPDGELLYIRVNVLIGVDYEKNNKKNP